MAYQVERTARGEESRPRLAVALTLCSVLLLSGSTKSPVAEHPDRIPVQDDVRAAAASQAGAIACMLTAKRTGAETVFGGEGFDNDVFGPDSDGAAPADFPQPLVVAATRHAGSGTVSFRAKPGRDSDGGSLVMLELAFSSDHPLRQSALTHDVISQPLGPADIDIQRASIQNADGSIASGLAYDGNALLPFHALDAGAARQEATGADVRAWDIQADAALRNLADQAGLPNCYPQ